MTPTDSVEYYERRAEDHVALAQRALNGQAVQAHYELASAYLDRIYSDTADVPNPGFPYCVGHCGVAYQAQLPRRDRKPPPPLPFGGPRVR